MTSIAERVRALKDRLGARRSGSSQADKADRARRRAEASAARRGHARRALESHDGRKNVNWR